MTNLFLPLIRTSSHFAARATSRCLPTDVAHFVLRFGTELPARGAVRLTVVQKDLPADLRGTELAHRSRDWVLVVDGADLITCYRRRNALRYLRRKPR